MGIDGEAIEFEWKNFSGFSSLSVLQEIQKDLARKNIQPEEFKDPIIFMSMFNDIQELRDVILARTLDVSGSRVEGEVGARLVTGREHACREEVWILIPLNAGSRSSAPSWGILHPLRGSWTSSQTISRHCWTSSRWSAWALLMHRAAARANCTTKTVSPESSHAFSASHHEALWLCLSTVLEIQGGLRAVDVRERRRPFLWHSVVSGLRSARRTATADCWASWV